MYHATITKSFITGDCTIVVDHKNMQLYLLHSAVLLVNDIHIAVDMSRSLSIQGVPIKLCHSFGRYLETSKQQIHNF